MLDPTLRTSRARRAARLVAVAATVAAVAGLAAPAGAAKKPKPVITITPGDLTVYKVGNGPQNLPDDVRDKVMATLTGYVNAATVKPLQKGVVDTAALAATLDAAVGARLTGPDRPILVDEGLPKATAKIVVTGAPVALAGLADGDGKVVVVAAKLDTTTTTKTARGKVQIKRSGELVLTPDADTWKISGYTLTVDRLGKGLGAAGTTTTTVAPGAPGGAAGTPATTAGAAR